MFFASGAAALIFENLWFHQAGLLFGNSVWATTVVLASFMGGLALGNGIAGRYGHRFDHPIRTYSIVEVTIALTGCALVFVLPALTRVLVPAFRPFLEHTWILNLLRSGTAFILMLVPTTAMGATLPLLVKALHRSGAGFGRSLGRLYGWNTLGAVAGVLTVELVLIGRFGIRGSALIAALLNGFAALTAAILARGMLESSPVMMDARIDDRRPLSIGAKRILSGAFWAGAAFLALELVWFRFLSLFVFSTSLALTLMLAVVLAGIGLGGLLASWLLRMGWHAPRLAALAALACGCSAALSYETFSSGGHLSSEDYRIAILLALRLTLPVALLSGALFPLLGAAAKEEIGSETRAVGLLALANTTGAMVGAFAGGFVLLPELGIERSLFVLAIAYGVVSVSIPGERAASLSLLGRPRRYLSLGLIAAYVAVLLYFPFGQLAREHLQRAVEYYGQHDAERVAMREGRTEIIQYLRSDWAGIPLHYRLVTNGFSMSSSHFAAKRYMKLYSYWPIAVHPNLRRALLICFGIGQTAKSLTDTATLERIDVVDTSREILEMGRIVFPPPSTYPLDDPRVRIHIEDARFFLQTTPLQFDLITGEPPPPRVAGVVNLYTREHFQIIRDRLAEGGITTYWLPVHQLSISDTTAIIAAFCDVFEDCSLWAGFGYDWMLVGTKNATGHVSEAHFARQWSDPVVRPELEALGFERPEQLGALFMADAPMLEELVEEASPEGLRPLEDDHPQRMETQFAPASPDRFAFFAKVMDTDRAQAAFMKSDLIRRLWPASVRQRTVPFFRVQQIINTIGTSASGQRPFWLTANIAELHHLLSATELRTPILWLLGSTLEQERLIEDAAQKGATPDFLERPRAARDLADRRYEEAERRLQSLEPWLPDQRETRKLRIYLLAMAGRIEEAKAMARQVPGASIASVEFAFWRFMDQTFAIRAGS